MYLCLTKEFHWEVSHLESSWLQYKEYPTTSVNTHVHADRHIAIFLQQFCKTRKRCNEVNPTQSTNPWDKARPQHQELSGLTLKSGWTHYVYYTTHLFSSVFFVLSYDSYHVFWVKMTTLFGVSILVTTYPEHSKQTLFCSKHNVSNLILRYPF